MKRVFAIAPAMGSGFTKAGLSGITIPVSLVVAQADKVTPSATNAARYAQLIKGSGLTILRGEVSHYTILAECSAHGKGILDICRDAPSIDRAEVHRQVAKMTFEVLKRDGDTGVARQKSAVARLFLEKSSLTRKELLNALQQSVTLASLTLPNN